MSLHISVIYANGLMWAVAFTAHKWWKWMCCMRVLFSWFGAGLLTFRHSPGSPISLTGLRLWQDPVARSWSGAACVLRSPMNMHYFNVIIIITILIIIMWQFYVKSLTRLFKLIPVLSALWLHLLFCFGGRNNKDDILFAIPNVISLAHIPQRDQ